MHAVILDIDGTLVRSMADDDALYRRSVHAILGPVSIGEDLGDYKHVTDSGILREILSTNQIRHSAEIEARVRDHFSEQMSRHLREVGAFPEVPGARSFLDALKSSARHRVAIATGGWEATARLKLYSAGFNLDEVPLLSSDTSFERTRIMQAALDTLGAGFESIRYFGDARWDLLACRSLGWQFEPVGPLLGGIEDFVGVTAEL